MHLKVLKTPLVWLFIPALKPYFCSSGRQRAGSMMMIAGDGQTGGSIEAERSLGSDNGRDDEPISAMVTVCELNLGKNLKFMTSNGEIFFADVPQTLQAKFVDWAAYLGVFVVKTATLDRRVERHQQYRDLVLLVLDNLNSGLLQIEQPGLLASCFLKHWLTKS